MRARIARAAITVALWLGFLTLLYSTLYSMLGGWL